MPPPDALQAMDEPLSSHYDCAMLDLDGVVYVGDRAVDGVAQALGQARDAGMRIAFVTNNASRTADDVADHLRRLGVEATAEDVVTSAQAAARTLAERLHPGAKVLVTGGRGLVEALRADGLAPVFRADERPVAVVQGFDRGLGWQDLAEAAYAVSDGAFWVASNDDLTIPTERGIGPGNGTLVNAVATAVGHGPDLVAGKPHRPLFDATVSRTGTRRPLVVGDRLDTDIEGAVRCGADSLLVLTGVTGVPELLRATSRQRPTYVDWDIQGLDMPHRAPRRDGARWVLGDWSATVRDGRLQIAAPAGADRRGGSGSGPKGAAGAVAERADGIRVACRTAWEWLDEHDGEHLDLTGAASL